MDQLQIGQAAAVGEAVEAAAIEGKEGSGLAVISVVGQELAVPFQEGDRCGLTGKGALQLGVGRA